MIPNSRWSCQTKPQEFSINKILPKPDTRYSSVFDIKTGGVELSESNGSLNSRYWMVYQQGSNVLIRGANDVNTWDDPVILFTESNAIVDISLSFDNLGRPVVFYQKGTELVLWFYDSQIGDISFKTITTDGHSPIVNFDYINETSNPESDIMMYYVRNDVAYMRLQRDRFDVEYNTGVNYPELRLENSGMTSDNRFQVTYSFRDMRDGSLLHRKCLESDTYVMQQLLGKNLEVGFTIALAPSDCELKKLYDDYGMGANGEFCIVSHSGDHQATVHPNEEHLFALEFMYEDIDDLTNSGVTILLRRTAFAEGYYLTTLLPTFRFTSGVYKLLFEQAPPEDNHDRKRIRLIKDGITIIDSTVPDLPSDVGNGAASRNRLRFGANVEYNTVSQTQYKNLFPAVFTDIYTIADGTRTDWFKGYSDNYTDSTPTGNPLTLRKNGDSSYIFSGGAGTV